MTLRPFFTYYGGKWRAAPRYPSPAFDTLVEPFAGSAGYSLRYPHLAVELYDADPVIAGVWDYLIHASEGEVRRLPLIFDDVRELTAIPQEARWLIGFCLNKGTTHPCRRPSAWMRGGLRPDSFWSEAWRNRVACQLRHIRHWRVVNSSYATIDVDRRATWFVDPPYSVQGHRYRVSDVNFEHLAHWCLALKGQALVCEAEGATWLPFQPFHTIKTLEGKNGKGTSREVLWASEVS